MAEKGHTVSTAALSQLELGHSTPSGRTLLPIAETTEFPLEISFGGMLTPRLKDSFVVEICSCKRETVGSGSSAFTSRLRKSH